MRKDIKILALIAVIVVAAAVVAAKYYREAAQSESTPIAAVEDSLVRPDSPSLGSTMARVTLVEFLDPECEACAAFAPIVKQILKDNEGKIRLVVRYMAFHPNSHIAAAFTEAAGEQGKYWQMQEMLFQRQPEWGLVHGHAASAPPPPPVALFERYASELGLDLAKIRESAAQNRHIEKVARDMRDGQNHGVTRTPTFFVNGRMLMRFSEQDLRVLIQEELNRR